MINRALLKKKVLSKLNNKTIRWLRLLKSKLNNLKYLGYLLGIKSYYPDYLRIKASKGYDYKSGIKSNLDEKKLSWGEAFCDYMNVHSKFAVDLVWYAASVPGNYGDWLSPYIISKIGKVKVRHLPDLGTANKVHLVAIGSIMNSVNSNSIVLGTGVNRQKRIEPTGAKFKFVRGLYTAKEVQTADNIKVEKFGDLGFLLPIIYTPLKKQKWVGKKVLVRHLQHMKHKIDIPDDYEELSIAAAKPSEIESFIDALTSSEVVYTSAMHCYITCLAYGVPVVLWGLDKRNETITGDGIKYLDSLSGVGLPEISPLKVKNMDELFNVLANEKPQKVRVDESVVTEMLMLTKEAIEEAKYVV